MNPTASDFICFCVPVEAIYINTPNICSILIYLTCRWTSLFWVFPLQFFPIFLSANLPPHIKLFFGYCCHQWEKLELRGISLGQIPQWWFTIDCWSQLDVICTRTSSVPPTSEWESVLWLFVLHFIKGCPTAKQPRAQRFVPF